MGDMVDAPSAKTPLVSVIIPFYGADVGTLRACLAAIAAQEYPADCVEVIVVDNNPAPVLSSLSHDFSTSCRLAHEPVAGSYSARNRGIALARGKVIAFTDADCRPDGNWLRKGVARITSEPGLGFVGGHISVTHRGTRPNIVEAYDMNLYMRQQVYVQSFRFGATVNLFTFASVIEAGGGDAAFLSGGDREWGERVWARGYRCAYAPDAIVFNPARTTLSAVAEKARRLVGQEALRARRSGASRFNFAVNELRDMLGQIFLIRRKKRELGPYLTGGVTGVIILLRLVRCLEWLRIGLGGEMQR